MFTIAHLHAVTDFISERVEAQVALGPAGKVDSKDELEASHAKRAEVGSNTHYI